MALCSDLLFIEDTGLDRLSAARALGHPQHRALGLPHRRGKSEATLVHRRLLDGQAGGGVGTG